jgi:hypothetical protein
MGVVTGGAIAMSSEDSEMRLEVDSTTKYGVQGLRTSSPFVRTFLSPERE